MYVFNVNELDTICKNSSEMKEKKTDKNLLCVIH